MYGPYLKFTVRSNCTVRKKISPTHNQDELNTLSATNEMQCTDRELIYTDRM